MINQMSKCCSGRTDYKRRQICHYHASGHTGEHSPPPPTAAVLAEALTASKGVEMQLVQCAGKVKLYSFYTAQTGDSLGAITNEFYRDARL